MSRLARLIASGILGNKPETLYTFSISSTGWDATIESAAPNANHNVDQYISHGYYNTAKYRHVISFDLTSIPLTATIKSATLALTCYDAAVANHVVSYYPVYVSWINSTVSWNNRGTSVPWGTAGCDGAADRASVAAGSVSRLTTDAQGTKKTVVLLIDKIQEWVSYRNANFGLLAKADNESTNCSGNFYSSNTATESNRPVLTITYTNNIYVSPVNRAINWIKYAQDSAPLTGGVKYYYTVGTGWHASEYQEVTGYIIPTMYDHYTLTSDETLKKRAVAMADWLVSVQTPGAGWDANVFDTGQVILGLCRAYDETTTLAYKTAVITAADWLLSIQELDGSWIQSTANTKVHSYDSRVAWALLRAWQITDDIDYKNAAIANLEWVLLQQNLAGWFANCGIATGDDANPLTHTIAYTAQGLLESGLILSDADYINAAILTADAFLDLIDTDGGLTGGNYHNNWTVHEAAECLTGSAQVSDLWWKLYHYNATAAYKTAAQNMNAHLVSLQGNSTNTGIHGGIAGSDPIDGAYNPNIYLSWATKFFIDALHDETAYG